MNKAELAAALYGAMRRAGAAGLPPAVVADLVLEQVCQELFDGLGLAEVVTGFVALGAELGLALPAV